MNTNYLGGLAVALALGLMGGYLYANPEPERGIADMGPGMMDEYGADDTGHMSSAMYAATSTCIADDCLAVDGLEYPTGTLPAAVQAALAAAIADEYKAHATYAATIEKFGNVRPFAMIIRAEEMHIASLKALFDKYGLPVPADTSGSIAVADTMQQMCQAGVQAEIANAALYREQLLPAVQQYPDIAGVFTDLMNASQLRHLPAFERCS